MKTSLEAWLKRHNYIPGYSIDELNEYFTPPGRLLLAKCSGVTDKCTALYLWQLCQSTMHLQCMLHA